MRGMKNTPIEEWKPAPSAPRCYEVSNLGNVRRVAPGKNVKLSGTLRLSKTPNGYLSCGARDVVGQCITLHIHREVARAFLGEPTPEKPYVNHKDSDRTNNRVDNLEWCSQKENMAHARKAGRWFGRHGVPVVQIDVAGNIVGRFSSVTDAAAAFGEDIAVRKNISAVCSRARRTGFEGFHPRFRVRGYLWMYESDATPAGVKKLITRFRKRRSSCQVRE